MSLTTNPVPNNAANPAVAALASIPDRLHAGGTIPATQPIVIAAGASVLPRGTVLGLISASGKYTASAPDAVDGTQYPVAVLADIADPTAGDVAAGAYLSGEFDATALAYGAWGLPALTASLRVVGIYIKSVSQALSNTDAT